MMFSKPENACHIGGNVNYKFMILNCLFNSFNYVTGNIDCVKVV